MKIKGKKRNGRRDTRRMERINQGSKKRNYKERNKNKRSNTWEENMVGQRMQRKQDKTE